jgi:hypothetical protein
MSHSTTTTRTSSRRPRPRGYAIPVVRPVPPRPAGTAPDDTW